VTKMKSFYKLRKQMQALARVEGDGAVAANGDSWLRSRTTLQPAFHTRHFPPFIESVVYLTRHRMQQWIASESFDLEMEMNYLAIEIIGKILFSADWSGQTKEVREAVETFRTTIQKEAGSLGPSS